MYTAKLITFEGIDCAGKTTQIRLLKDWLDRHNIPNIATHQPHDAKIRELILSKRMDTDLSPLTELLLYMADRKQHCQDVVIPALREGKMVLCDRFVDSSVAYQGYGRGLDISIINQLNDITTIGISIDLTLLLDLDVDESFRRRSNSVDRIESLPKQFFDRVMQGYVMLADQYDRIFIVDANQSEQVLHNNIVDILQHKLKLPDCVLS